jgi:hypothetical protein
MMKLFLLMSDDRTKAAVVCAESKKDVDMSKLPQFQNIYQIGIAGRSVPPGCLINNYSGEPISFIMAHNIQFE